MCSVKHAKVSSYRRGVGGRVKTKFDNSQKSAELRVRLPDTLCNITFKKKLSFTFLRNFFEMDKKRLIHKE